MSQRIAEVPPAVRSSRETRPRGCLPVVATGISAAVAALGASPAGLNQIEIWFSILVRKLLKRANFKSHDDLKIKAL
ncbi:hypothetical protein VB735_21615 [Halotia wernerae UHCC 0503]|nr:hypothetical protein [Halotia wernerae UHCC 0503]